MHVSVADGQVTPRRVHPFATAAFPAGLRPGTA
jgi:hypothetical protein